MNFIPNDIESLVRDIIVYEQDKSHKNKSDNLDRVYLEIFDDEFDESKEDSIEEENSNIIKIQM